VRSILIASDYSIRSLVLIYFPFAQQAQKPNGIATKELLLCNGYKKAQLIEYQLGLY